METGFDIAQRLVESASFAVDTASGDLICPSENDIFNAISAEAFPRGEYVTRLIARRICKSFGQINSQGGGNLLVELNTAGRSVVRERLLPLYGVGEKFVDAYCLLAGIQEL